MTRKDEWSAKAEVRGSSVEHADLVSGQTVAHDQDGSEGREPSAAPACKCPERDGS
ncbi:MAG TPA: hypothetical protein VFZ97_10055 [Acidimicrobiales bacterium]